MKKEGTAIGGGEKKNTTLNLHNEATWPIDAIDGLPRTNKTKKSIQLTGCRQEETMLCIYSQIRNSLQ